MEESLVPGLVGEARTRVTEDVTARRFGSGSVDVFATPAMVALMEEAAIRAVDHLLPPGSATVGSSLEVRHLAPTPVGLNVVARATLREVHGRRLVFDVEAFDDLERIGEGRHERVVVDLGRFHQRAAGKARPAHGEASVT
ncbi:MAG TPA: thioesterase family protein [Chloroflexota bacterium]